MGHMREMVLVMGLAVLCGSGARAQSGVLGLLGQGGGYGSGGYGGFYNQGSYGAQGSADPCRRSGGGGGGAFGALANMVSEPGRSRDCADMRRAQWADYNARQKAAKDRAEADAAAVKKAAADADAARVAAASQAAGAHAAVAARRSAAAAVARRQRSAALAEAAAAQRVAAAEAARGARAAAAARRAAYVAMVAAENSAGNLCRQSQVARGVMDKWNGLGAFRDAGVRVIDIEHFTTVAWHGGDGTFACHGVFVTNKGWRVVGTAVMKRNVAGDPLFVWQRDGRQDLADYEAPAMDAGSPEVASGVSLGGAGLGVSEAVAKGGDGRM